MTASSPAATLMKLADLLDAFPYLPSVQIHVHPKGTKVLIFLDDRETDFGHQKLIAQQIVEHYDWISWRPDRFGAQVSLDGDLDGIKISLVLDPARRRYDTDPDALLGDLIPKAAIS